MNRHLELGPDDVAAIDRQRKRAAVICRFQGMLAVHAEQHAASVTRAASLPMTSVVEKAASLPDSSVIMDSAAEMTPNKKRYLSDEEIVKLRDAGRYDEILSRNSGLVWYVINNMRLTGTDRMNAVSDGMLGLWEAAQKYDGQGAFSSLAYIVINRRIIDGIRVFYKLRRHRPIAEKLKSDDDDHKDISILAETAVWPEPPSNIIGEITLNPRTVFLDNDQYELGRYEIMQTSDGCDIAEEIADTDEQAYRRQVFQQVVATTLSAREQEIIRLHLAGFPNTAIAEQPHINVTASRIGQIMKAMEDRMQKAVQNIVNPPAEEEPEVVPEIKMLQFKSPRYQFLLQVYGSEHKATLLKLKQEQAIALTRQLAYLFLTHYPLLRRQPLPSTKIQLLLMLASTTEEEQIQELIDDPQTHQIFRQMKIYAAEALRELHTASGLAVFLRNPQGPTITPDPALQEAVGRFAEASEMTVSEWRAMETLLDPQQVTVQYTTPMVRAVAKLQAAISRLPPNVFDGLEGKIFDLILQGDASEESYFSGSALYAQGVFGTDIQAAKRTITSLLTDSLEKIIQNY